MEESAKTVGNGVGQSVAEEGGGSTLLSNMTNGGGERNQRNIGMLMDLDLPVSVELGRIQMMVKEILELGPGALIELNKFLFDWYLGVLYPNTSYLQSPPLASS